MDPILSLDIGGTKIAAALLTRHGDLLAARRAPSLADQGPDRMIDRLLELCRELAAETGTDLRTAGISCGGPLDPVKGIVLNPPNLPGWDRTPLRAMIADGLHLDPRRVHLENDANAGALAELRFGAARGRRHAIFLTMSTGIGGGLILDGRLYRGATSNAGEVGHQVVLPGGPLCGCGNRGCLEAVASGSGIAARLQDRFHTLSPRLRQAAGADGRLTAEHLIQAVRDGDGSAIEFFEETVTLLARGIANLVFVINPEIVILGTIGWHAGPTLLDSLREQVGRMCWPVLTAGLEIVASPLGLRLEQLSGLAVALEAEADAP